MFNFFRFVYRRLLICFLLYFYNFVEFISSLDDKRLLNECEPIDTNEQLLNYTKRPIEWNNLVEPIVTRCGSRLFDGYFLNDHHLVPKRPESEAIRPKVLVCHDMAGGYRGDKFINGSKKWDDYRFYHWAGIDIFNYFSHHYITVPPLTWINAAHRNGVPILGTYIVEGGEGNMRLSQVLNSVSEMERIVEALTALSRDFKFDGWLVNIECGVSSEQIPMLQKFVRHLTKRTHEVIAGGQVIWYDSVTETGSLWWQNEVNKQNIHMYEGTDGILLNYWWGRNHLQRSAEILKNDKLAMSKVYVGIDVFGRSQTAKFRTYETLEKIKEFNFSVGIFAPGWTFEAMNDETQTNPFAANGTDLCNHQFLLRNNRFWSMLWENLYVRGPETLPFYTSFCLGSGKRKYRNGIIDLNEPWMNLREQEYQPTIPFKLEYQFDDAYHGGSCVIFRSPIQNLRLFASYFPCDANLVVSYAFKRNDPNIRLRLILNVQDINENSYVLLNCDSEPFDDQSTKQPFERNLKPITSKSLRYVCIGLNERQEKTLPSSERTSNNWEIRYFYLTFAESAKWSRIVDIGITATSPHWKDHDFLLLGAMHIHSGVRDDDHIPSSENVPPIDFRDAIKPSQNGNETNQKKESSETQSEMEEKDS